LNEVQVGDERLVIEGGSFLQHVRINNSNKYYSFSPSASTPSDILPPVSPGPHIHNFLPEVALPDDFLLAVLPELEVLFLHL
jgi:hypothetical protein